MITGLVAKIRAHEKETIQVTKSLEQDRKLAEKVVKFSVQAENLACDIDRTISGELRHPCKLARQAAEDKLRYSESLLQQYLLARAEDLKELIQKG